MQSFNGIGSFKLVKVEIKFGAAFDVADTALYEILVKIFKLLEHCF